MQTFGENRTPAARRTRSRMRCNRRGRYHDKPEDGQPTYERPRRRPPHKMSAIEVNLTVRLTPVASLARKVVVPVLIFVGTLLAYYLSTTELFSREPPNWFQHHVFLAKAMLNGSFDVGAAGIPDFYHDTITDGTSKYVTFPPGPSVLLLPFVAIWGTDLPHIPLLGIDFSQIYLSMVLGAMNAVLFWYVLGLLNVGRTTKLLLVPFFAFF